MSPAYEFLYWATVIAFMVLSASFLILAWRIVVGPTMPDRILALDMLVAVGIGFIAVFAVRTGFNVFIDIAIALGLVGFLSTVALARFVLMRSRAAARRTPPPEPRDAPETGHG